MATADPSTTLRAAQADSFESMQIFWAGSIRAGTFRRMPKGRVRIHGNTFRTTPWDLSMGQKPKDLRKVSPGTMRDGIQIHGEQPKGASDFYRLPPGRVLHPASSDSVDAGRVGRVSFLRGIGVPPELARGSRRGDLRKMPHDGAPEDAVDSSYAICNLARERRASQRGSA